MSNLAKLSAIAAFCFSMIVFGACGGGGGGGGGGYNPGNGCERYLGGGFGGIDSGTGTNTSTGTSNAAYTSCMATHTGSSTGTMTGNARYTVTNGVTYIQTGTDTIWNIYNPSSTSTSTQ